MLDVSNLSSIIWQAVDLLLDTIYLWLPILLFIGFWQTWLAYIRATFVKKQGSVLLEIKIPREILKSPAAMELVLTQLYQPGGAKNYFETYWDGKVPPWFSLELVSIEGAVHFYIWTHEKFKDLIETQIYAQYPTVEVYEVEDYVEPVTIDTHLMWGSYFKFTNKNNVYPIKTYVEYGLDKDPKEEFKIDPISSIIEYLGSLKKGEQAWFQILIQAHKKRWIKDGFLFPQKDWKDDIKSELKKIREEAMPQLEKMGPVLPMLGEGPKNQTVAIERNMTKPAFDAAIRGMYIADSEESFRPISISGLIGSTKAFGSNDLNGFKPGWYSDVDHPWSDFRGIRVKKMKKDILDAYKRRSYFQAPYRFWNQRPLIMTTEELATMFHFPGQTVSTPSFTRIPSRKAEPPSNLPV